MLLVLATGGVVQARGMTRLIGALTVALLALGAALAT
jgi:hypothetical protein